MNKIFRLFIYIFLLSSVACQAFNKEQSFDVFWLSFREAALKEDYLALQQMVKFPFKVKGVDDETPAKHYIANQLPEVFPLLLEQVVYSYDKEELIENNLKELIRKRKSIHANPEETEIRVDQFEFEKIDGQWFLVEAYLE